MGIQYLGDAGPDGTVVFRSGKKGSFFGVTTVTGKQAVVTTVDSTTITTVDTTVASTGLTAEATLVAMIEAHALAINRVIADSRATSKAVNQTITKLRALGLFASS